MALGRQGVPVLWPPLEARDYSKPVKESGGANRRFSFLAEQT